MSFTLRISAYEHRDQHLPTSRLEPLQGRLQAATRGNLITFMRIELFRKFTYMGSDTTTSFRDNAAGFPNCGFGLQTSSFHGRTFFNFQLLWEAGSALQILGEQQTASVT